MVDNVAAGFQALQYNEASYNTAVGSIAHQMNEDGYYNVAVGYHAITATQYNDYVTAIGAQTYNYGDSNTIAGYYAGVKTVSPGYRNTVAGYYAAVLTTGSENVVVGENAYSRVTDDAVVIGSGAAAFASNEVVVIGDGAEGNAAPNCVVIGHEADANAANDSIAIGHDASVTGTNNIAIGKDANSTGANNTAVGGDSTATGANSVALGQGSRAVLNATALGAGTNAGINSIAIGQGVTATLNSIALGSSAIIPSTMVLGKSSIVATYLYGIISAPAPGSRIVRVLPGLNLLYSNACKYCPFAGPIENDWVVLAEEEIKRSETTKMSESLMNINPVLYRTNDTRSGEVEIGIDVNRLEEICPDLLNDEPNDDGDRFKYARFLVMLLQQVQAHHKIIQEHDDQLQQQQMDIEALVKENDRLKHEIYGY
jgi:hypothetical protein